MVGSEFFKSLIGYRLTKSGLMVFGFCPAGSTSTQLPSDQLEGCLVGFVEDGQKIHS